MWNWLLLRNAVYVSPATEDLTGHDWHDLDVDVQVIVRVSDRFNGHFISLLVAELR